MKLFFIGLFICCLFNVKAQCTEVYSVDSQSPSLLPEGKEFNLVWHDEFDGQTLDMTKWRYRTAFWGKHAFWYANEKDNAVELKDGKAYLKIVKRDDGQFVSPQLQTGNLIWDYIHVDAGDSFWTIDRLEKPLFTHRYGYYECRCRLQQMPGWWSAFWMQSLSQGTSTDPHYSGVEQDIMESFEPGTIIPATFHYGGYGNDHKGFTSPRSGEKNFGANIEIDKTVFHTFGLLWEPDGYTVYIDGVARGAKVGSMGDEAVSQIPQFILVSTECKWYRNNGCNGKAAPELEEAWRNGDAFIVDYVRVYDIVNHE